MGGNVRTYEMTWLGQPALALETDGLRVVTVPHMGAKIVSLFDKVAQREWLLPPINRPFMPVDYASVFVEQDMSGWDEMFPNINAGEYPVEGEFHQRALPDHGEVWALPWAVDHVDEAHIQLSTHGKALPYQLTRTIQVLGNQKIRLAFTAVNTGETPFVAFWTAHPQFIVDGETRIKLPAEVTQVVNVYSNLGLGEQGETCAWPSPESSTGKTVHLDQVGGVELQDCRKFYLLPEQPVTWSALQQGDDGDWIRLSCDPSDVPYLGIWVDEGTYNAAPTVALEPSSGFYDELGVAWKNGRVVHFDPHVTVQWSLDIELGSGTLS